MGVLIESKRDERTVAGLIDRFGDQSVRAACGQIAGCRRAYVPNVAKALGVACPKELAATPAPEAPDRIREILRALGDAS